MIAHAATACPIIIHPPFQLQMPLRLALMWLHHPMVSGQLGRVAERNGLNKRLNVDASIHTMAHLRADRTSRALPTLH